MTLKKLTVLFFLFVFVWNNAQEDEKKVFLKANVLFLPIAVFNVGSEFEMNNKITLQPEIFISPWKSFDGKYMQIYMAGIDARYYFRESFKGFYVAPNFSLARYKMQKFNYWKEVPYQNDQFSPVYLASDLYQDGYSLFFGATVGYQFKLKERWNMDLFVGVGNQQAFYKGKHKYLGVRYDNSPSEWNRSGEWIPYKGGIMVSYQLK